MPRIPYLPVDQLQDPELIGYLEYAARHGTPRPESQAVRAHVPAVLRSFSRNWQEAFRTGVTEHRIKELCRGYVSATVQCHYCGSQRSLPGGEQGLTEDHYAEVLDFETSERYGPAEKAALRYTSMLVWNPEGADDAIWAGLREHFSEDQIVELGYFVALTYGQQRWIKTLGIGHREVLDLGDAGLAPGEVRR
jgi:alkylhydroperoxidase family enzyme